MTTLTSPPTAAREPSPGFDLLRVPVLGPFLRGRHARILLQIPLLLLAVVLILDGLFGSPLAPKNSATVLTWVHYRGFLVLALLAAGNVFCMACPLMLPRNLARRLWRPPFTWPRALRNKWTAVVLMALVLFAYELFDLWSDPMATGALLLGYFAAAFLVDSLFRHASFCKYVCPIGQFNFAASTASPLEVRVRSQDRCARCATHDCIKGRGDLRGCELFLFLPRKVGNLDCTFCLDCVHSCPHDNVAIAARLPASELWSEASRSGIGNPGQRADLAALATLFTFGALLNAFAMVSPIYALEEWLARLTGIPVEWPILGALFVAGLVIEPVLLLGLAAWAARRWAGLRTGLVPHATRYALALMPLGFGVWLAHYAFHFLTGFATAVPVIQSLASLSGTPFLGSPAWTLVGMRPEAVLPIEIGLLGLGVVYSLAVLARLATADRPDRPHAVFVPWAALHLLLAATALWLLRQPMEMRGTMHGG